MNITRIGKYYWLKFIRLRGNPQPLAWGAAIGVFIGLTPTLPLHSITLIVTTFLTRTSFIAAFTTSFMVCNPLTYIPIYYFSFLIGNTVTPYELNWQKIKVVLDLLLSGQSFSASLTALADVGREAIIVMLTGGVILALPFTIVTYFVSLKLFLTIRDRRRKKHLLD